MYKSPSLYKLSLFPIRVSLLSSPHFTSLHFPFFPSHYLSTWASVDRSTTTCRTVNSRRNLSLQLVSAASATSTTIWAAWDPHQTSGTPSTLKKKKDTPLIEHFSPLLSLVFMILACYCFVMMHPLMDSE